MEITKKEVRNIIIVAFIAAFVLSINEWGIDSFDLSLGISNLLASFIFCLVIYSFYVFAQKLTARYYEYDVSFEIMQIKKKIREVRRTINIPIGPIITFLITFISAGKFFFIFLNSFELVAKKELRTGRKWTGIKECEEAQVGLSGPLSLVLLLIIFKIMSSVYPLFEKGMFLASTIMIFNLLPIPKADGSRVFFGSRALYLTGLIFSLVFILLIFYLSIIQSIILALILAVAVGVAYLYKSS